MAALRGEFREAASHHAFAALVLPLAAAYVVGVLVYAMRHDRWPARRIPVLWLWLACGGMLVFGLLRNLPGCDCLAP